MNTRRQLLVLPLVAALADPPPDWSALRRSMKGTLVRPGQATYDAARRLFNPEFDRIKPSGVAYCADAADVARCLTFAGKNRVGVTARSGGHSYAGWSTGTGLVVDVSKLDSVTYAGGRAVVGAGAKLIDVYDKLGRQGVSIPAGSCPSVGVGGLTLGGGIGVVSRKYGLTCDRLESVQLVTADGRVLTCDANHNADLFWACRGGGGGNFGIAVSFTFRTHRTRDVTVFFLHWPWAKASAALKAWQAWAPTTPDELWSNLHLKREHGQLDVMVGGLHLGGQPALERLLKPLIDRIGTPSSRSVRPSSYQAAMMVMAGCSDKTVEQCRTPGRTSFVASSHLAYQRMSGDAIKALKAQVAKPGSHAVLMDAMGGAIARVPDAATAFPHRAALFSLQYYAKGSDRTWLRGARSAMGPHLGDHAYVNYIDPDLPEWRRSYYGSNADRLAAIKAARDPGRLFHLPQGI